MIQETKRMLMAFFWTSNLEARNRLEKKYGEDVVTFALSLGYICEGEYDKERGTYICYLTRMGAELIGK